MPADHSVSPDTRELVDFLHSNGPYTTSPTNRIETFLERNIVLSRETPADGEVTFDAPLYRYTAGSGPETASAHAAANPNWLRNKARNYLAIADHIEKQEKQQESRPTVGIDLDRHIVIPRGDLPQLNIEHSPSGNGVLYVFGHQKIHSSIGPNTARKEALEWLAIADHMEQREQAGTARKDEITKELFYNVYGTSTYASAGANQRAAVDWIHRLEQQVAAAKATE